jgi:glycosyltransferase involved in cell wall biosynthesis/predicted O-methyltransferase YrrM
VETTGSPPALASVVVLCRHRLESLRRCLAALARHTRRPWELIAVDDGGDAATAAYLAGIGDVAPFRVEVVTSSDADRGLAAARGDYLVLLDGDAVVADGWLDQLIALVESGPEVGMAGAMSNAAPPPQRADGVAYADIEGMDRAAMRWRDEHRGRWRTVDSLSGPCVLIKRCAFAAAGAGSPGEPLDVRVRRAGFALAVAHDLLVHAGPWPAANPPDRSAAPTRIVPLARDEFARRYGDPDTGRALCAYTPPIDTHAVLTLLAHARPRRILEVGTALGHMTANLTEWSPAGATVVSLGAIRGVDPGGAAEQAVELPEPGDLGRLRDHFGKGDKAEVVAVDTRDFDFARLDPVDFAFIDGGHGLDQVLHDSRAAYAALASGGYLVWHDVGHPAAWVRVREAIGRLGLAEAVEHVAGTMVAFLRKGEGRPGDGAAAGPLRLMWEGDFDGLHSLGLINRNLARALIGRDIDMGLATAGVGPVAPERLASDPALEARRGRSPAGGPPEVWVAHRWPPRLDPPPTGRWAFFQPWEYGRLPKAWLAAALRADEVWAYSRSVRDVYVEAGVPADRVHVVPLGVDPEVFRPGRGPAILPPGPAFRFLFVGGTIHRKGIDLLLAAYERAFCPGDGVGLVIQDMGVNSFYRGQTAGAAIAALRDRGYPVEHRVDALAPDGLAGLYAACDCVVQPYRGEGFALPVAEAMACGLPAIVTGAGPALDYASEATAYLIPARRVELAENRVGEFATVGRPWLWEPDVGALVDAMRQVVADPAAARAKGTAAARSIRAGFTWDHAAAAVEARLRALAGSGGPATVAVTPPRPLKVSLTMIVRDEEANLPACLASAAGLFDEIIVVDTGSTDRTAEIARSFGARVFDFIWVDDFAAARNAALARATGDYAFWLDADDRIEPAQRDRLRALFDGLRTDDAAYVVRCSCDADPRGGGATVVDHVRLFPVREGVRWTYRVHEQILPALRRDGVAVRWTDAVVRHVGYNDPALRNRKLGRDRAILESELADRPDDPFVLFNLGAIALEADDPRAALGFLRRSLDRSAPTDSITRKLYALIARCHQLVGEPERALAVCGAGLAIDGDDAELWFRTAVLHRNAGDPAKAESCWRKVLTLGRPERFSSVDEGIYGHLTRRNLAALAEERRDHAEARAQWSAVLGECPGDAEARRALTRLIPPPTGAAT